MPFLKFVMIGLLVPMFACSSISRFTEDDHVARAELEAMLDSDQALRAEIQDVEGISKLTDEFELQISLLSGHEAHET